MGIIYSRGCARIPGKKELTAGKGIKVLDDPSVIGKIYFPVTSANGKDILLEVKEGDEVKVGTKLGVSQGFYVPYYSPVSGKIIATEKRFNSLVGRPINHLVIENDFKNESVESLNKYDYDTITKEEIVAGIKEAGIVGLGGAGFPTYIKYGAQGIHHILINACECEPYLTTDHETMLENIDLFLKGVSLLIKGAGADNAIVGIKKTKVDLITALNAKIGSYKNIEVRAVKDEYPAGWERTLIWNVFKKEYKALPSEIGVIVNNAQTAIAVAQALLEGKPITHRVVTVSGEGVNNPQNVCVPVGTPVGAIIEAIGGYSCEEVLLLAGGPMCSKSQMNDQFVTEKQTGGITVLKYVETEEEPCWHCGNCTLHCPASLQPVEIKQAVESKNLEKLEKLQANSCIECGMCSYICPSKINVTEFIRKAKLQLRIAAAKNAAQKK